MSSFASSPIASPSPDDDTPSSDISTRHDMAVKAVVYGALSVVCLISIIVAGVNQLVLSAAPAPDEHTIAPESDVAEHTPVVSREQFQAWAQRLIARRASFAI